MQDNSKTPTLSHCQSAVPLLPSATRSMKPTAFVAWGTLHRKGGSLGRTIHCGERTDNDGRYA